METKPNPPSKTIRKNMHRNRNVGPGCVSASRGNHFASGYRDEHHAKPRTHGKYYIPHAITTWREASLIVVGEVFMAPAIWLEQFRRTEHLEEIGNIHCQLLYTGDNCHIAPTQPNAETSLHVLPGARHPMIYSNRTTHTQSQIETPPGTTNPRFACSSSSDFCSNVRVGYYPEFTLNEKKTTTLLHNAHRGFQL